MKTKIFASALLSIFLASSAQAQKKEKRESPPATSEATIGSTTVKIDYSQPSVKGRKIFGDLVPFGKIWRTGANEATTIEFSNDVMIQSKKLAAGKYSLFTIPGEKEWTIIFNSVSSQWGAYRYKEDKDVLRVKAGVSSHEATEKLSITIDSKSGMIHIDWATTRVRFEIKEA
tara:strand:+ start:919 stop:1437 length:519 start_codon:yes stop_codon:yes gene_type:complete